jgi:hypothetical protein
VEIEHTLALDERVGTDRVVAGGKRYELDLGPNSASVSAIPLCRSCMSMTIMTGAGFVPVIVAPSTHVSPALEERVERRGRLVPLAKRQMTVALAGDGHPQRAVIHELRSRSTCRRIRAAVAGAATVVVSRSERSEAVMCCCRRMRRPTRRLLGERLWRRLWRRTAKPHR